MKPSEQTDLQKALGDKNALRQVAQSKEAQALAGILSKGRDPGELRQIAAKAAKGDMTELSKLISSIASSPGGAQLLQKLNESMKKK